MELPTHAPDLVYHLSGAVTFDPPAPHLEVRALFRVTRSDPVYETPVTFTLPLPAGHEFEVWRRHTLELLADPALTLDRALALARIDYAF